MRALITGCAGFAGSHLADYLLGKGEEVIALVRADEDWANIAHIHERLTVKIADLRDADRITEIIRSTRPQRIYHLAAISSPTKSSDNLELTYQVNFLGTLNLLSAWLRVGMDSRFLLVSTSAVYGKVGPESLPMREVQELSPLNPYAGSKSAAEIVALQCFRSYGLPVIRVRPFNHTGPRQSPDFVCSDLSRQVAEISLGARPSRVIVGNVQVKRDFSDVRDIVRGYDDLMERGEPGEVYHLCSGQAVSIESVLQHLVSQVSQPIQVEIDPSRVRADDCPEIRGDFSKARNDVGWTPKYELQTTLDDLAHYWHEKLQSQQG